MCWSSARSAVCTSARLHHAALNELRRLCRLVNDLFSCSCLRTASCQTQHLTLPVPACPSCVTCSTLCDTWYAHDKASLLRWALRCHAGGAGAAALELGLQLLGPPATHGCRRLQGLSVHDAPLPPSAASEAAPGDGAKDPLCFCAACRCGCCCRRGSVPLCWEDSQGHTLTGIPTPHLAPAAAPPCWRQLPAAPAN